VKPALAVVLVLGLAPALLWLLDVLDLALPFVRLERPWAAAPCAACVSWIAWRLTGLSRRRHRVRRTLTALSSGLSAVASAYAVVGLELGRPLDRLAVVVAVDRSRSIDFVEGAAERLARELSVAELGMRDGDRIGTLAFAAEAAVEDPLRPKTDLPAPQKAEIGRDGTDIGAAIRRALAELPPDSAARIVIVSDGVSTRGDALAEAAAARAAGVPIDVVPLDQRAVADVRVVSVRMPSRASEGEALDLRVVTSSSAGAEVEVRVYRDGALIRSGQARIAAGEDVLHLREQADSPGLHRYDVEVSAQDPQLDQAHEDNAGAAFVHVRGQASALILEQDPELAAALARAWQSAAFAVRVAGPSGVPSDPAGFAAYDLIALSDIQAKDLAPSQLSALAAYVRDLGGGVLLLGGDRSLGPGGYARTPVEEVSPVAFDVKQERRRASLAQVIAVDYSGSMAMTAGKNTKLELANEAAVRSAELLGPGDRLGVLHVDTAIQWTVPLGPATDKAEIARKIRAVGPGGGGIYIDLTLVAAYGALHKESAQLKHLLLFSDGADAEERQRAFSLVSGAQQRGITTSVVALGKGPDVPALERMSQLGGGRFYLIEDAARLPAVFAQETILATRSSINEVAFRPAPAVPGPALRGIDFNGAPELTGYVVTVPKGRSQVHLIGPEGDPILATWSIGIGRSAAFTSDYKDRWGAAWTGWDGAGRLFGQLARDLARRTDNPRVRLNAAASGGVLELGATVVDERGRVENFRRLVAQIAGPDGFSARLPLEASGAGLYSATLPLSRPGAYVTTLVDEQSNTLEATAGAALSTGEELRPTGSDRALLRRIAETTGGRVRDTLAGIFHDRGEQRFAFQNLELAMLLAAAFTLLLSVGTRRLGVPDAVQRLARRLARPGKRQAEAAHGAPAAQPAATLAALRQVKARGDAELRAGRNAPLPAAPEAPRSPPPLPATRPQPPPPAAAPPGRPLTSAEILLQRRRGRLRS
jgi:Ca-activated chloride channel family protein